MIENHMKSIAVIGAGLAGLSCAQVLTKQGLRVEIFDKARAVGGRATTRRRDGQQFDLGAQYIVTQAPAFQSLLKDGIENGTIAPWSIGQDLSRYTPDMTPALMDKIWVGLPGMDAVCQDLAEGMTIHLSERVGKISRPIDGDGWVIESTAYGADQTQVSDPYAAVICAMPVPQTVAVLDASHLDISDQIRHVAMLPCWTLLFETHGRAETAFHATIPQSDILSWLSIDSAKPGRPTDLQRWVAHARTAWSQQHVDADRDWVGDHMIAAACQALRLSPNEIGFRHVHRWLYARAEDPLGQPFLWDRDQAIGICGDWCLGTTLEAAFISGADLGQAVAQAMTKTTA